MRGPRNLYQLQFSFVWKSYKYLGKPHVSFPSKLAVRCICCFVWSAESEGKLSAARSPVLLNVKSSCYFTVSNNISFILYVHLRHLPVPPQFDSYCNVACVCSTYSSIVSPLSFNFNQSYCTYNNLLVLPTLQ